MPHTPFLPQTGAMLGSLSPGWYAYRSSNGTIGLILHHRPGAINLGPTQGRVVQAIQINRNTREDLPTVLSRRGPDIEGYLRNLGGTPRQIEAFMVQADVGAGKQQGQLPGRGLPSIFRGVLPFTPGRQTTQLNIPRAGSPTASSGTQPISTKPSGDVQDLTPPAAKSIADAIGSNLDFLKWISWIFNPLNLLRAVEFLTGLAFIFYGLNVLMHRAMHRSTHRTTFGGTLMGLFRKTPVGRAAQVSSARRRGRRAGQIQAERDTAYRGARQERARREGAGRRTTPGSGTGGTGQGSSALEAEPEPA